MNDKICTERIPEGFTATAHTGCLNTPDNTLESIEVGINCGADIFEIDLNFDAEGTPVLSHDSPQGSNNLLFDDALSAVSQSDSIRINIDIKSTANLEEMERIIEKHGLTDRVFLTGVDKRFMDDVMNRCHLVSYYLNYNVSEDTDINEVVQKTLDTRSIGLNTNYSFVTEELVELVHKNNLLISVWTVNNTEDMIKFINMGVDNITTRNPDKLLELLER